MRWGFTNWLLDIIFPIKHEPDYLMNYLYLHREIIKVLNSVYDGYRDDHLFKQPSSEIVDNFNILMEEYTEIERKQNYVETLKESRLMILTGFKDLVGNFEKNIETWRHYRKSENYVTEDLQYINKWLINDKPVECRLRVIGYELRDLLPIYEKEKNKILHKYIFLNRSLSNITIKNKTYPINLMTKPFKFLGKLLDAEEIVSYKELAKYLDLNCSKNNSENVVNRAVQDVRRELGKQLFKLEVPKKDIDLVMSSIRYIPNTGYVFDSSSH